MERVTGAAVERARAGKGDWGEGVQLSCVCGFGLRNVIAKG